MALAGGDEDGRVQRRPSSRALGTDWFLRARLKLRHLQLLMALDEHRNLHRAAEALNMSQPAASKLLGELERMTDVALFERLPRGVEPNWYGEVLVRHARTVLSELNRAGDELTALISGEGGSVAIGAVTSPAIEIIGAAIEEMQGRHPRLHVRVDVETSDVLVRRLVEARLDFAIARIPEDVDPSLFAYEEAHEEELCFLVGRDHPLLGRGTITPDLLAGQSWVLNARGTLLRRRIEGYFREAGIAPPERIVDTGSVLLGLSMIARNGAIMAVSRSVAALLVAGGGVAVLPVEGRIKVEPFGLVRVARRTLPPAAEAMFQIVGRRLRAPHNAASV